MVYARYWAADYEKDMDRQRRKQAEFLVHRQCEWNLIQEIGVLNQPMKERVENILGSFGKKLRRPITIKPGWYY